MPTLIRTESKDVPVLEQYLCPSRGKESSSAEVQSLYAEKTSNPTDSRPKPVPLIGNPTGQPKQATVWSDYGGAAQLETSLNNWCGAPDLIWFSNGWRKRYRYWLAKDHWVLLAPETPSWSLELRNAIKSMRQNVGNYLVELEDTKTVFNGITSALTEGYGCLKGRSRSCKRFKSRFTAKRGIDHKAAETYLYSTFGVVPLLSDLGESIDRLTRRLVRPVISRVSVSDHLSGHETEEYVQNGDTYRRYYAWKSSCRATAYIRLKPGASEEFTMGNPLEAFWEAVAFSYIVDYLIPVGEWLSALDALAGIELLECTITWKTATEGAVGFHPDSSYRTFRQARWTYESHERTVEDDIPMPSLPRVEITDSGKALLNSIATLRVISA